MPGQALVQHPEKVLGPGHLPASPGTRRLVVGKARSEVQQQRGQVSVGQRPVAGYGPVASSHLLAPALHLNCVPPDHPVTSWIPDSQLARAEAGGKPPGNTVEWLGWTEIGGCGESLTIKAGAR